MRSADSSEHAVSASTGAERREERAHKAELDHIVRKLEAMILRYYGDVHGQMQRSFVTARVAARAALVRRRITRYGPQARRRSDLSRGFRIDS